MKIIIDIPEKALNTLNNGGVDWLGAEHILDAVSKGIPYEERPTGQWISARGTYYCSCCKHYAFERQMFDFCQDCGAKMIDARGINNE